MIDWHLLGWIIAAFMAGATVGVVLMAALVVSGRSEE